VTALVFVTALAACSSTVLPANDGGQGGGESRGGNGGSAGASGLGGATGNDSGNPCQDLVDQYAAAYAAARSCNPALNQTQCGSVASATLVCPSCPTHVQDGTQLDAIRTAYFARTDCWRLPCPAYLCINAGTGVCQTNAGGGSPGICADVR
jgi:hypothetical protein